MVLRDRDGKTWRDASDGVLEERRYLCQKRGGWRNDTALIATGALVESMRFAAYGETFNCPAGDVDSDGDWDATDAAAITGGYDVNKDIDMDGSVGASDLTAADAVTGGYHTEGRGVLSADEVFFRKGYAGYEIDPVLTGSDGIAFIHHVRHRVLSSYTGRWNRRDPEEQTIALYEYASSRALIAIDPHGTIWMLCGANSNNEPITDPIYSPGGTSPGGPGQSTPQPTSFTPPLEPISLPAPVEPPNSLGVFLWYGYHCGKGYGDSYEVKCGPDKGRLHLQRCGKDGDVYPPGRCPVYDKIDECCREHDKCFYLNCQAYSFFRNSCCQQQCDRAMCNCLDRVVRDPAQNLSPKQIFKIDVMRFMLCSNLTAAAPLCPIYNSPM